MSGESVVAWAIRISVRELGGFSPLVLRDISGAARLAAVLPGLDQPGRQAAGLRIIAGLRCVCSAGQADLSSGDCPPVQDRLVALA